MSSKVEELCQTLASAFADGRLEFLSDNYVYPLAVYSPGGVRVEMTPEETADTIFARRTRALKAGMRSVRVRIDEIAEMHGGRIPIRLSWDFLDAEGRRIGTSSMRYYCRRFADGTLRVEMIEFTEQAFTDAS